MIEFCIIYNRKKNGSVEIRAYENATRQRKYYPTKIRVLKSEWSDKDKKVSGKNGNSEEHNFYLRKYIQDLENLRLEKKFKGLSFTFEDIKSYFKQKKEKTSSFILFVKQEIETDLILKEKTKKQHRNTLKILQVFTSNNDVLFSDINFSFVDSFNNFLKSRGYQQNTIHKHHKNIKKFIGLALKKEFTDVKNPYEKYKVKSEQKSRDVLTIREVQTLAYLTFNESESKLKQVRDMFLFACFTGLRISDVHALQNDYIKSTDKGFELDFTAKKTGKRVELPLYKLFNGTPQMLLKKYIIDGKELVFPLISEQFINRHLKVLAQRTEIKFNLTFHIGRETFGTYMATKVQPFELMRLMQHSDIKTTMRYVHLSKQMINESLDKTTFDAISL